MSFHMHYGAIQWTKILCLLSSVVLAHSSIAEPSELKRTYPRRVWQGKRPSEVCLKSEKIDTIARLLKGRGCIVRQGYIIKAWGSQSQKDDWMSSSKPVFSTLLFFAVQEGKLESVHTPIKRFGWDLCPKDEPITFHHLANMISGHARPEKPGAAWAYNDYAINLYRLTLFDRLFQATPSAAANDSQRLGPLQFEDGLSFSKKARVVASVRDFARLCWFWLNKGKWGKNSSCHATSLISIANPMCQSSCPTRTKPKRMTISRSGHMAADRITLQNMGRASTATTSGSTIPDGTIPTKSRGPMLRAMLS